MKKLLAIGVILLFVGMTISSSGFNLKKQSTIATFSGNTLYVGGSGTGNYSKIQDAIDNASDGDTVFVYNDSSPYYENVKVYKSINLNGENRDTTIIWNTLDNGCCVKITGNLVNISGFGITNSSCSSPGINMLSSKNSTIYNCSLYNNYGGMWIQNSFNISIIKCDIFESMQEGIMFYNTDYSQIRKCNIYNNRAYGICTDASIYNTIEDCNFLNHDVGIYLDTSSHNTNIRKCKIFNNRDAGIRLDRSNFTVVENCIISNSQLGIFILDSNYNSITENIITSNLEYGISIYEGNDNIIYHNNLINNTNQAYDECNNAWDDGYPSGGNYWDDYTGEDNDGDGIGDTPYNISGGDNQDLYPLMYPWYPTHPDTVYVDDDYNISTPGFGYDCFNRIQYGVNEVQKKGEIYVFNGTYFENVVVDKSISLIGEDRDTTVIGSGGKDVVCVKADYVTITGFTLQNNNSNFRAIAVRFSDSTKIFRNNIKGNGCGVYLYWSSSNYISDNIISNNKDYGFYLVNSHDNNISKNYIIQNSRPMEFADSNRNIIIKNIISDNYGGGVGLWSSSFNIFLKNTFRNNAWNAAFQWADETIFFHRNIWLRNYWDRPRLFPKPIIGLRMIQNGEFFLPVPCVAFDWRPAMKPYDIEV